MPEESVTFPNAAGEILAGTLHLPGNLPQAGVVLAHCFTCSRHTTILRRLAQDLTSAGIAALRFDFSGNGQSQGRFAETSYSKHIAEMVAAADFLARRNIVTRGLAGHSMGAAVALLAAGHLPELMGICTLAGRLGGLDPTAILDSRQQALLAVSGQVAFTSRGRNLQLSQAFFDDARSHDVPGAIAALPVPLLVVHGARDEVIPAGEAQKGHQINPEQVTLEIVPGADHMFSREADRITIVARVTEWFQQRFES